MGKLNFKIEVNKENLLYNYSYLKRKTGKDIIAVIKANGYGHDIKKVIDILLDAECDYFAVAREREAEKIIDYISDKSKILILESIDNIEILKTKKNLEIVINSLAELERCLKKDIPLNQVHLKIDFGFGRNGIQLGELKELKRLIKDKNIYFRGIMSHLFSAELEDMKNIEEKFMDIILELGKERFEVIHLQNSAGVMSIEGKGCTHIRCGTILFGLQEIGYYDSNIKRVFRLVGPIEDIKEIDELKYIGYERKKDLKLGEYKKVGKIRLGYGDGFSKRGENIMSIINNKKYRIIHISMDTSFIAIDDSIKIGDEVEIFYDLEESMKYLGVPHYEFISCINDRIERVIK